MTKALRDALEAVEDTLFEALQLARMENDPRTLALHMMHMQAEAMATYQPPANATEPGTLSPINGD